MQGQGYRGSNTDPTHGSYLAFLPQGLGPGYARGAAIGRTESEPQYQRPLPPLPQNLANQFPGQGYPNNGPKAFPGGLIGDFTAGGRRNQPSQQPSFGEGHYYPPSYGAQQQQLVARLRIGVDDSSSAQPSGQVSFYRGPPASYPNGASVGQRSNHPGLESRHSQPPSGTAPHLQGFLRGSEALPLSQAGRGSIGQVSQAVPSASHRTASGNASILSAQAGSYASQQLASPFVPASTSHPIVGGGAASQFSMPSATEDAQPKPSFSLTDVPSHLGSTSNLGSISQMGSLSQMGSIGTPSLNRSNTQSGGPPQHRSTGSLTKKIKAVCSSGGHFVKLTGGGFEYQGGETRLIQVPNFCRYSELLESLERLAGSLPDSSSGSSQSGPSLKYQLPSEPNVYVDLVDDEDTQLMFDDWHDYSQSKRDAACKLHLFVDWKRDPSQSSSDKQAVLRTIASVESMEAGQRSAEQMDSADVAGNSAESARAADQSSSAEGVSRVTSDRKPPIDFNGIAGRMEVIQPKDVSLVKYLGSGGYGEVYLGKWHSSEAAIKCLNPSLFYNEGQVSQAAIAELIREADLLGCLRHPNVVWVYGVVLPKPSDEQANSDSDSDRSDDVPTSAAQQHGKGNVPGSVRPPAIVTEFMSQGSLKGALQRKADIVQGPLMRVLIAMDAAKGMEYLHQKNIVHFDLKSANLLLGWRDRRAICKVADFGLSKQKKETYVSNVSSQRGTLPWIAPEIIKSPHAVTEKVDVFSFGVVLWELWTGKEPYDGLNYHALLHQLTTSDTSLRPALPGSPDWDPSVGAEPVPGYRALMERCWTESPAGRPGFSQIVKVLKDMATSLRPRKPRPPGPSGATSSSRSSRLPSSSLPASSVRQPQPTPTPSESRTATPGSQGAAVQPPSAEAGSAEAPKPDSRGEATADKMANPFAAQSSQKPEEPSSPGSGSEQENNSADRTRPAEGLPAAHSGGPSDAKKSDITEALSLGTAIDDQSSCSSLPGESKTQPKVGQAEQSLQQQQNSLKGHPGPGTPTHQAPVSAFTALASKPERAGSE